jgi:hypothetical protein
MFDNTGSCRKSAAVAVRKGFLPLVSVVIMAGLLGGCGSSAPESSGGVLSVRLEDGAAWLGGYPGGTQLDREGSASLTWNQAIWTGPDEPATLLVSEDDQLWLDPGSGFRVTSPLPPNERPVLRLIEGRLRYRAASNRYALGTRFEVPSELRILVTDLIVAPAEGGAELELVIEDKVTTLAVLSGEVAARGNDVEATLFADWRAIVRPGEPMEVFPPRMPDTPTPTVTPMLRVTRTVTPTPTPVPSTCVLENPHFDQGLAGWEVVGGDAPEDPDVGYPTSPSRHVVEPEGGITIQQSAWFNAATDFSVWVWAQSVNDRAAGASYLRIFIDEYPDFGRPYLAYQEWDTTEDGQWHEYRLDFTAPADGYYTIRFEFGPPPLLDGESGQMDLHFDYANISCNGPLGTVTPAITGTATLTLTPSPTFRPGQVGTNTPVPTETRPAPPTQPPPTQPPPTQPPPTDAVRPTPGV